MKKLLLVRHREKEWNKEHRFTESTDVDVSQQRQGGSQRSSRCPQLGGLHIDVAYTSVLKRGIHTLWAVLDKLDLAWIPCTAHGVSMSGGITERCKA